MFNFSWTNYTYFKLEALYFILFVIFFYFFRHNFLKCRVFRIVFLDTRCVRIRIKSKYECRIIIIIIWSYRVVFAKIIFSSRTLNIIRTLDDVRFLFFYLSPISQSIIGVYSSDQCTHTHTYNIRLANFIWFFLPAARGPPRRSPRRRSTARVGERSSRRRSEWTRRLNTVHRRVDNALLIRDGGEEGPGRSVTNVRGGRSL